ncbi:uncharacterized protein LOC142354039 isoform X2 [Convolutriloba macropyga]|uniref:uncharacterized protein LOC142354039 isoform X2 n=1 Tax=Convolutriloba macropyga TaxID=536237 RepID=UPI003F51AF52
MHFILFLLLKVLCVVLQFHELSTSICFAVFMETNLLKEPAEVVRKLVRIDSILNYSADYTHPHYQQHQQQNNSHGYKSPTNRPPTTPPSRAQIRRNRTFVYNSLPNSDVYGEGTGCTSNGGSGMTSVVSKTDWFVEEILAQYRGTTITSFAHSRQKFYKVHSGNLHLVSYICWDNSQHRTSPNNNNKQHNSQQNQTSQHLPNNPSTQTHVTYYEPSSHSVTSPQSYANPYDSHPKYSIVNNISNNRSSYYKFKRAATQPTFGPKYTNRHFPNAKIRYHSLPTNNNNNNNNNSPGTSTTAANNEGDPPGYHSNRHTLSTPPSAELNYRSYTNGASKRSGLAPHIEISRPTLYHQQQVQQQQQQQQFIDPSSVYADDIQNNHHQHQLSLVTSQPHHQQGSLSHTSSPKFYCSPSNQFSSSNPNNNNNNSNNNTNNTSHNSHPPDFSSSDNYPNSIATIQRRRTTLHGLSNPPQSHNRNLSYYNGISYNNHSNNHPDYNNPSSTTDDLVALGKVATSRYEHNTSAMPGLPNGIRGSTKRAQSEPYGGGGGGGNVALQGSSHVVVGVGGAHNNSSSLLSSLNSSYNTSKNGTVLSSTFARARPSFHKISNGSSSSNSYPHQPTTFTGLSKHGKSSTRASTHSDCCYIDPIAGAQPPFTQRLQELVALEGETIKYERQRRLGRRRIKFE